MKIIKSIVLVVLILMVVSMILPIKSIAANPILEKIEGQAFDSSAEEPATKIVTSIIAIVRIVATGTAIIILIVLAMKYMSAAPGEKAEIKKHAVVYIIGATVLFATTGILGILEKFSGNIS